MNKREVSDAVKNLEVNKEDFDRALKALIATPPIRKTAISAHVQRAGPGLKPGAKHPRLKKPSR
jgi:hypothetical protein